MATALFWKKRIYLIVSGVLSTLIVCLTLIYAYSFIGIQTLAIHKSFYFLVSSSTHIEASTSEVNKNGGAGYLFRANNREYVAYSVYLTEREGQAVCAEVSALNKEVELVTITVGKLYLKTREQKDKKENIEGAFQSLYGCIEVLNGEIERLAKGATQQSTKRVLEVLHKQFEFLSKEYEKIMPNFYKLCNNTAKQLLAIMKDTIFVKDLRYISCEICHSFARLAEEYAL